MSTHVKETEFGPVTISNESADFTTVRMAEAIAKLNSLDALQLSNKHHGVSVAADFDGDSYGVKNRRNYDDSWKEKIPKPQMSKRMAQLLQNAGII